MQTAPLGRLPVVGVMGSGVDAHETLAVPLGRRLAGLGVHLLTGGGRGVMTSVSRAFAEVEDRVGLVIGVLPSIRDESAGDYYVGPKPPPGYPNPWVELPIRTHLGKTYADADSRNHVNVLSSDVVVALPGSLGTTSEIALAVCYSRPVVLFGDLERASYLPLRSLATAETVDEVVAFVNAHVGDALRSPVASHRAAAQ